MGLFSAQDDDARLDRIEAQLWKISQHLGIDCPPMPGATVAASGTNNAGMPEDVVALWRAGKKIEAIKRYRELTGLGLKESKDACEAIDRMGGGSTPPPPSIGL